MNNQQIKSIKVSLRIPSEYNDQPIIFKLANQYNLEVNIISALLGELAEEDGWFTLSLKGEKDSIKQGLQYLTDSKIEIWNYQNKDQKVIKDWEFEGWILND